MSRASPAQRPPDPDLDWSRFPRHTLRVGQLLYRAARRRPWWFCSCMQCRFDLSSPRGTCFLGTDPVAGLLEYIGMEWTSGMPVTRAFLQERTVHTWEVSAATPLADLVSRRAVAFKVTNELSDMTPYTVPQRFAATFDQVVRSRRRVFDGVRYRTRFDTGRAVGGVALFGEAGLLDVPSAAVREVDGELVSELHALGLVVEDPPALTELDLAPDP